MRRISVLILALLIPASACARRHAFEILEIAAVDTAGWAHDIALDRDALYVSDRQGGFLVFRRPWDWSRPAVFRPVEDVISLAPNDGTPVLASRFEGLVRVSADGKAVGKYSSGDIANAVATRGDYAFAAYGLHGLVIARLARDAIQVVAELSTPGWSHDVKLSRDQAFLADWQYGLRVVDIRDPEHPSEVGALATPATTIAVSIRESGEKRFAALAEGHGGVSIAELDDAGHPRLLGRNGLGLRATDAPHPETGGWAHGVAWSGRHIFVADWKRGLAVLDAEDAGNPTVVRELPVQGTALGVKTELQPDGSWLVFLADGEAGIKVYRVRE